MFPDFEQRRIDVGEAQIHLMESLGYDEFLLAGHDRASREAGEQIEPPLPALWGGASGTVSFDPLEVWERWAADVQGRELDCGHFVMEEAPEATLGELRRFLS